MQNERRRCTAIVLAAGSGRRMKSDTAKQFMLLRGKPLLWYSLRAVEQSEMIDDCILVTGEDDIPYVQKEIVENYGFRKVTAVVAGGSERWESVGRGLEALSRMPLNAQGYVFIHDGARPFLTEEIIRSTYEAVLQYHACVAAVPSKDTVKLTDEEGFAVSTPDRRRVWTVQTPQVFDAGLIIRAYEKLEKRARVEGRENIAVTDDAGVVELFMNCPVKMAEGSYRNIKITTPEDLKIAEAFLRQ